jgi:hypothetical protein
MLPSAEAMHLRRVPRNLLGVLSDHDLEGNRNPQGGAAEAEERAAAGRMKSPEAVPEEKTGYGTADTCRSNVFICVLAGELYRHRRYLRATKDSIRRAQSPTCFCLPVALTHTHDFREFFDSRSRLSREQSVKHGMLL